MYFDIDSEHPVIESDISFEVLRLIRLLSYEFFDFEIYIASAFKYNEAHVITKYSFHCITNVACSKSLNLFLAEQLNK